MGSVTFELDRLKSHIFRILNWGIATDAGLTVRAVKDRKYNKTPSFSSIPPFQAAGLLNFEIE